jgi:hypothetical protein
MIMSPVNCSMDIIYTIKWIVKLGMLIQLHISCPPSLCSFLKRKRIVEGRTLSVYNYSEVFETAESLHKVLHGPNVRPR